jgi:hypothetical protein
MLEAEIRAGLGWGQRVTRWELVLSAYAVTMDRRATAARNRRPPQLPCPPFENPSARKTLIL